MQEARLEEIRTAALDRHATGRDWHFHILSPICVLNTKDKYAFVFEAQDSHPLVYYSDDPEKELGAELSPLLHKAEPAAVLIESTSADQKSILDTAEHLNDLGVEWHHHVLFLNCKFNVIPGKFCLMLENSKTNEVLQAISDTEPLQVIKELELLFYKG